MLHGSALCIELGLADVCAHLGLKLELALLWRRHLCHACMHARLRVHACVHAFSAGVEALLSLIDGV